MVFRPGAGAPSLHDFHYESLLSEEAPRIVVTATIQVEKDDSAEDKAAVASWLTKFEFPWEAELSYVYELPEKHKEAYQRLRESYGDAPDPQKSSHAPIDEDASDALSWYADADGDGFGDPEAEVLACDMPSGHSDDASDCDDDDAEVHPEAQEACTGVDDDCDGLVDDEDDSVEDQRSWYPDADSDGLGVDDGAVTACDQPSGHAAEAGDCDDSDPSRTTDCSEPEPTGCGCASGRAGLGGWLGLVILVDVGRRRREV